ncbi:MAG: hypothetical protein EOP04_08700 [Proteobacteria bacterium]|nr:MAG: hypothetical protein EOP04_08700 [Pseudomonadota bacterium]
MKTFIRIVSVLSLSYLTFACGSSSSDKTDEGGGGGSTEWSNTQMYNLVQSSCATSSCHDGAQTPNFKTYTEAQMRANTTAKTRVANNEMPVGGLSAANKQIFADFYK